MKIKVPFQKQWHRIVWLTKHLATEWEKNGAHWNGVRYDYVEFSIEICAKHLHQQLPVLIKHYKRIDEQKKNTTQRVALARYQVKKMRNIFLSIGNTSNRREWDRVRFCVWWCRLHHQHLIKREFRVIFFLSNSSWHMSWASVEKNNLRFWICIFAVIIIYSRGIDVMF